MIVTDVWADVFGTDNPGWVAALVSAGSLVNHASITRVNTLRVDSIRAHVSLCFYRRARVDP